MIKTKLPVQEKEINAQNQLVKSEREIEVEIDTSLFAEERWEQHFPHNAKNETLFAYVERIKKSGLMESKAQILSNLKALYCFLESKELPDFKSFLKLFDLADAEYLTRLVEKIKFVFEIALSTATADGKN